MFKAAGELIHGLLISLGLLVLVLFAVEVLPDAWHAFLTRDEARDKVALGKADFRAGADGFAGIDWAPLHYKEIFASAHDLDWRSYVYWRRKPFTGITVNVDQQGHRRTWRPEGLPADAPRIFAFGGSAVFGWGARDDFTIPSMLAKLLEEKGCPAEVTNFGEDGYVSTQETIALLAELQHGNRPDLVVFHDGFNDAFAAYQANAAGLPHNESTRAREFNLLNKLYRERLAEEAAPLLFKRTAAAVARVADRLHAKRPPAPSQDAEALASGTVAVYAANVAAIEQLGAHWRFKSLFFWQPTIYGKSHLSPYEARIKGNEQDGAAVIRRSYGLVAENAALAGDPSFTDLQTLFAQVNEPLFTDSVHVTEAGSERVARAMLPRLSRAMGCAE